MSSWAQFAAEEPGLAQVVRAAFAVRKHATMATARRDGSPRISGTEVDFADDGVLYLGMMLGTMRAQDLRGDPRVAVHSPTIDPPADNPAGWLGEGKINATVVEVEPDRFRLDIDSATLTAVAPGGDALAITTWHGGRGRPPYTVVSSAAGYADRRARPLPVSRAHPGIAEGAPWRTPCR